MDLLQGFLSGQTEPYCGLPGHPACDAWVSVDFNALLLSILNWDIIRGGMIFLMAVAIGGYVVVRIRRGFGV